jgi:hypothetical protein
MPASSREPISGIRHQAAAFLHAAACAAISGAIAGIIAGGMGGRVAMRVTALTAGEADQGRITDADEVVGVISFDGTMFLVVAFGIGVGLFGGMLYAGARPWLRGFGLWKGVAFGSLLLASLGWTVIERDNFDFHRFGVATLNVSMFAAIFMAFGVLVALVYELLDRRLPRVTLSLAGAAGLGARALGIAALAASVMIAVGIGGSSGGWSGAIPVYVLIGFPLTAALLSWRLGGFSNFDDLRRAPFASTVAVAAIAVPIVLGVFLDARAIVHHLAAACETKPEV